MDQDKRFCPNCGTTNVEPDFRRTNVLGEMLFDQNKWLCNECGYTGIMPAGEASEDIEFDEEEAEDPEVIDTSAGKAYAKYIVYVVIPASLVFVMYLLLW